MSKKRKHGGQGPAPGQSGGGNAGGASIAIAPAPTMPYLPMSDEDQAREIASLTPRTRSGGRLSKKQRRRAAHVIATTATVDAAGTVLSPAQQRARDRQEAKRKRVADRRAARTTQHDANEESRARTLIDRMHKVRNPKQCRQLGRELQKVRARAGDRLRPELRAEIDGALLVCDDPRAGTTDPTRPEVGTPTVDSPLDERPADPLDLPGMDLLPADMQEVMKKLAALEGKLKLKGGKKKFGSLAKKLVINMGNFAKGKSVIATDGSTVAANKAKQVGDGSEASFGESRFVGAGGTAAYGQSRMVGPGGYGAFGQGVLMPGGAGGDPMLTADEMALLRDDSAYGSYVQPGGYVDPYGMPETSQYAQPGYDPVFGMTSYGMLPSLDQNAPSYFDPVGYESVPGTDYEMPIMPVYDNYVDPILEPAPEFAWDSGNVPVSTAPWRPGGTDMFVEGASWEPLTLTDMADETFAPSINQDEMLYDYNSPSIDSESISESEALEGLGLAEAVLRDVDSIMRRRVQPVLNQMAAEVRRTRDPDAMAKFQALKQVVDQTMANQQMGLADCEACREQGLEGLGSTLISWAKSIGERASKAGKGLVAAVGAALGFGAASATNAGSAAGKGIGSGIGAAIGITVPLIAGLWIAKQLKLIGGRRR